MIYIINDDIKKFFYIKENIYYMLVQKIHIYDVSKMIKWYVNYQSKDRLQIYVHYIIIPLGKYY